MKRRKWDSKTKVRIVLEGLSGMLALIFEFTAVWISEHHCPILFQTTG